MNNDFIAALVILLLIFMSLTVSTYCTFQPHIFRQKVGNKRYLIIEYINLSGELTYRRILRYV